MKIKLSAFIIAFFLYRKLKKKNPGMFSVGEKIISGILEIIKSRVSK